MTQQAWTIVVVAGVVMAGIAAFALRGPAPEQAAPSAQRVAEKTEPATEPKAPPPPAPADLTADEARILAGKLTIIEKVTSSGVVAWTPQASYGAVSVRWQETDGLVRWARQLYRKPAKTIVISLDWAGFDGPEIPGIPILVIDGGDDGNTADQVIFKADGRTTPFTKLKEGAGFTANLSLTFHDRELDRQTLRSLAALTRLQAPWSKGSAATLLRMLELSFKKLSRGIVKSYPRLLQLNLGPAQDGIEGVKLTIPQAEGGDAATLQLEPALRPSYLASVDRFARAEELTSGQMTRTHGDVLTGFWRARNDNLPNTCGRLEKALSEDYGFHLYDTALVFASLLRDHALLAPGMDYTGKCLSPAIAAAFQRLGLPSSGSERADAKPLSAAVMNNRLDALARVLRSNTPETKLAELRAMLAERVTLSDKANIWLFGDGIVGDDRERLLPGAEKELASEQILALPVTRFGCYSTRDGGAGRRATLGQLAGLSSIWELEFSFNAQGKINAVSLEEANRQTICRAVGNRPDNANACYFARNRAQFPAVRKAGCGG